MTDHAGLRAQVEAQAEKLERASAACRAERGEAPVDVSGTPFACADCQTNADTIRLLRAAASALDPGWREIETAPKDDLSAEPHGGCR